MSTVRKAARKDALRAAVNPAASAGDSGATRPHRTAEKYLMDIGYVKPLNERPPRTRLRLKNDCTKGQGDPRILRVLSRLAEACYAPGVQLNFRSESPKPRE